jgi:hypothetical protein
MEHSEKPMHYNQSAPTPSLALSLLSQGNNGSFNKPFAKKYGLYAAIMLSELIYLQDLFIHKKNKGMTIKDDDGFFFIGFFRSYDDLHTATSIPLDTIRRKGNAKNPISVLRNLGIIKTASTTVGESFKRVIVYTVMEHAVHEHISIATAEYYDHINAKRLENDANPQVEMTTIRGGAYNKGTISEPKTAPPSLSCAKHTTGENRGLQSETTVNNGKSAVSEKSAEKGPFGNNALQGVSKTHSSNTTNPSTPTTHSLNTNSPDTGNTTTNPSRTNPENATGGTNHPPEVKIAVPPDSNKYSQEVVDGLYANNKALYAEKVADSLSDYFSGRQSSLFTHQFLLEISGLPKNFKASNKDLELLYQLKDTENSLAYTEAFSEKIIRNSVLIKCGKRRRAFGQLFVGLNMKGY